MIEAVVGVALRAILASVLLGGVLTALVFLATRTLSLTAATRHALWTTALVATALMPLASVGVSMWKGAPAQPHDAAARASSPWSPPQTTWVQIGPLPQEVAAAATPAPAPSFADRLRLDERLAFAAWTPRVSRALALGVTVAWALGALIGLIGLAASVVRVRGLKRRSSPLDGTLADELPWLTEVGPGREIYLRLSYETETPVAIGFRRPVILIPTELATADGLAAIESLILHEHAHLRRNDDWTNLLQRAIERVFWFNPIVWFLGRRIALEREIASDDAVVEKTGEAHAYATSLWKLAREMRMPEHAVVAPGALLTRKQITVRIEQLLDKRRARLHRSPAAALGVAVAGLAAVAFVATSAPAVELPAEASPITAASTTASTMSSTTSSTTTSIARSATTPRHAWPQHHAQRHVSAAPDKPTAKQLAIEAAAVSARIDAAQRAAKTAATSTAKTPSATNAAALNDARAKSLQAQLDALRRQLAAVKHTAGAPAHEKVTIRIADGAPAAASPGSSPHELPSVVVPPVPPMPAVPSAMPVIPPHAFAQLQALGATTAASERATRAARVKSESEVERVIAAAVATIPHQIAFEMNGRLRRARFDGMKVTRDMVASCVACSFRNADARGVDLHELKLSADDFTGADLRGANLSGAKLAGLSLAKANLANADLRGTQLTGVELRDANFDGAQLDGIRLTGVSIRRLSLRGASLRSVVANCTGCDFGGLDLHGQDLHGLTLTGADFSRADLHDANLSGVRFFSVDLSHANLNGADLTNARLETCNLDGVELRGARTTGMTTHNGEGDG